MNDYKEYRKKVQIFAARKEAGGRESNVELDIWQNLRGKAWQVVEGFDVDKVAAEDGWKTVLDRIDKVYKYDARTELPTHFEFVSSNPPVSHVRR